MSLYYLFLLSSIAATSTPAAQYTPVFPTNSVYWQLTDAIAELRDPRSTPLERQVARLRLEQMGFRAVPAVRRVAEYNPSPEVRAIAQATLAYLYGFTLDIGGGDDSEIAEGAPGSSPFAFQTPDDAMRQLRFFIAQAKFELVEEALRQNIDFLERGSPGDRFDAPERLSNNRPLASAALPALVRTLNDPNSLVRDAALFAISADAAAAPIDQFLQFLTGPDRALSQGAMCALERFAPDDPRFLQFLHPAPSHESLLAQLRSQLPEQRVQGAAYIADQKLIPDPVAAALLNAARSGDFVAREGLVLGIERAWADGRDIEPTLRDIQAGDPDPTRRAYAGAARRAIMSSNKPD
jgi:hypothetical protein